MLKTLLGSINLMIRLAVSLLSTIEVSVRKVLEVVCKPDALKAQLAANVAAPTVIGQPLVGSCSLTRNSAGGYVSMRKASDPFSLVSV